MEIMILCGLRKNILAIYGILITILHLLEKFEENKEYEALVYTNIDMPYDLSVRINVLINGKPPTVYTVYDKGILLAVAKVESQE